MSSQEQSALSKKPFRLFDLPAELRDIIYDFLPCGRRVIQEPVGEESYRLYRADRPLQRFALVSKQFGDEYSQRASKSTNLHVQDIRALAYGYCRLHSAMSQACSITFDVACSCDSEEYELENHTQSIQDTLAQATGEPTVLVRLYFQKYSIQYRGASFVIGKYEGAVEKLRKLDTVDVIELYSHIESSPKQERLEGTRVAWCSKDQGWKLEDDREPGSEAESDMGAE